MSRPAAWKQYRVTLRVSSAERGAREVKRAVLVALAKRDPDWIAVESVRVQRWVKGQP